MTHISSFIILFVYALSLTACNRGSSTTTPSSNVNISAEPSFAAVGQTAMLIWSATGTSSCMASGDWSGAKSAIGSQAVGPFMQARDYSYALACDGGAIANTTVTAAVPTLTVTYVFPQNGLTPLSYGVFTSRIVIDYTLPGTYTTPVLIWSCIEMQSQVIVLGSCAGRQAQKDARGRGSVQNSPSLPDSAWARQFTHVSQVINLMVAGDLFKSGSGSSVGPELPVAAIPGQVLAFQEIPVDWSFQK